jgi:GNAT superfamily N-acetyltransferase
VTSPSGARADIEAYLRRAPYLHLYELGDLDPRELVHTTWLARRPVDQSAPPFGGAAARGQAPVVDGVVLIYTGLSTPTIIALADGDAAALHTLLETAELPARCYAHLTAGLEAALAPRYRLELLGHCLKMALVTPVAAAADDAVIRLSPADADEAVRFYAESYPAGYFEPVNLERGPYVAIRDARGLAAVAGTHVYSPIKRVTSLGNIATRPDCRGLGYARRVTAGLCRLLQSGIDERSESGGGDPAGSAGGAGANGPRGIDLIGLNVRADNPAAIACYRSVGFEVRHAYDEWLLTAA